MTLQNKNISHPPLAGLEIEIQVVEARGLLKADRNFYGKKVSSDPYVRVYFDKKLLGRTATIRKTVSPEWNQSFRVKYGSEDADRIMRGGGDSFSFQIMDDDASEDEPIGHVSFSFPVGDSPKSERWYPVGPGTGKLRCRGAKGEIRIQITVTAQKMQNLIQGNRHALVGDEVLRIGLGWELERGVGVDLDTSCVAIDEDGHVLMEESVYYGNLINSNESIKHSGDEQEGDEDLDGTGDDEVIMCDLDRVPGKVLALYFILTVASPGKSLGDVQSARVRVANDKTKMGICQFVPMSKGDNTALFLVRLSRNQGHGSKSWTFAIIDDTDPSARDFGSLIPKIKSYSRDIVPDIKVDPKERVAVMRKGGTIRLRDYSIMDDGGVPDNVTFGLAWDVTDGVNIDLDASAICLDASLNCVDTVYFNQLKSKDGSITHSGDERSGQSHGDDEKISVRLGQVPTETAFICFVINSYSGEELDDVKRASCHLFDTATGADIALYNLSNCKELDKHTALLMACLYRQSDDSFTGGLGDWYLRIISEAALGRTVHMNVGGLQNYLRRNPPQPGFVLSEPDIVVNMMPGSVPIEEDIPVVMSF